MFGHDLAFSLFDYNNKRKGKYLNDCVGFQMIKLTCIVHGFHFLALRKEMK